MSRVLMVVRASRGGAFDHVVRLSRELASRGHEVAVCGPIRTIEAAPEIPVLTLAMNRSVSPLKDAAAVGRFSRIARAFRPDFVHAHGSKGAAVARVARLARPRTPVIHTPHEYPFDNYFSSTRQKRIYWAYERALAPLTTLALCVCDAEARHAERLGVRSVRVVHNGIRPLERGAIDPKVAALAERGPVIAAVGELRPAKGMVSLVEAMPALLQRHQSAHLAIAGDGSERIALDGRIRGLGLSEHVTLLGYTPDVASVLAGASVFVNPAWSESFPYSILEAMSVGLPIVATDVGGTIEAVRPGVTGLVVEPHDPGALASAMADLIDEPDRSAAMGAAARELQLDEFTYERMIDGTLAAYGELKARR
jgi:glycosyltransferase involved in cell wall biosynthesis